MNEYKNPIKKFWQLGSTSSARVPHFSGTGAPTTPPNEAGLLYLDNENKNIYISVGMSLSDLDWIQIN
jgi:hypothetical protein